jgi:hypothetical protein
VKKDHTLFRIKKTPISPLSARGFGAFFQGHEPAAGKKSKELGRLFARPLNGLTKLPGKPSERLETIGIRDRAIMLRWPRDSSYTSAWLT